MLIGSRKERVKAMHSLEEEEWNLNTLLHLHLGICDHAEDVRYAAIDTLMEIVTRSPEPLAVSPIAMLTRYMFEFTVASGGTPNMFRFLVQLGTPEAAQAVEDALKRVGRNEDFKIFLDILIEAGMSDIIEKMEKENLSKTKTKLLNNALQAIRHDDDGSEQS